MALKPAEHKRMVKLYADCFDPKTGKPRPDATTSELKELSALIAKAEPEAEIQPVRIKNYKHSEKAKELLDEGAEFQGAELRNFGTSQKPVAVLREWFYRGKKEERKAVFVQHGNIIEAGRTIAKSAYTRFQR